MRFLARPVIALLITSALASSAFAQAKVKAEAGWGWRPRQDRWTPIFVTASSDHPQNAMLRMEWPQAGRYIMRVEQAITLNVHRQTFPIYLPVHGWDYADASFTLCDRETGKTLARFPEGANSWMPAGGGKTEDAALFVGVSGSPSTCVLLQQALGSVNVGYIEPRKLPTSPIGFDALDLLILNGSNFSVASIGPAPLGTDQQQAIVDWVRAGGRLIVWPGEAGIVGSGPLVDALPAKTGERQDMTFTAEERTSLGLPEDTESLRAYAMQLRDGAQRILMLDGRIRGARIRLGLGLITVVSFNVDDLQVDGAEHARDVWKPLLASLAFPATTAPAVVSAGSTPIPEASNSDAEMSLATVLSSGDVESRRHSVTDIFVVLLGVLFLAGPVDWLVLKSVGRRPWTVTTILGIVGFIAVGAVFAKSSRTHPATVHHRVTIKEQVNDSIVATSEFVAVNAASAANPSPLPQSTGWWRPAVLSPPAHPELKLDMDFHQSTLGNAPLYRAMPVWNYRFLLGERIEEERPLLSANLLASKPNDSSKPWQITGTLSNNSDLSLKDIRISRSGIPSAAIALDGIAPHITQVPISTTAPAHSILNRPMDDQLATLAAELDPRMGGRMEEMVSSGDWIIIFAKVVSKEPGSDTYVRILAPLQKPPAQ